MRRRIYYLFSIICFIISLSANALVSANPIDRPPTLEQSYIQLGYKSVEEAIKEFENHFELDVKLPSIEPSIPFSHQFGRFCEDNEYDVNDTLEIDFMDEKSPENHYKIDIRPLKNKITLKPRPNQKVYTLQDGKKALYLEERIFNALFFDKGNWQYIISIDKRVSDKVTPEVLVEIANSIE